MTTTGASQGSPLPACPAGTRQRTCVWHTHLGFVTTQGGPTRRPVTTPARMVTAAYRSDRRQRRPHGTVHQAQDPTSARGPDSPAIGRPRHEPELPAAPTAGHPAVWSGICTTALSAVPRRSHLGPCQWMLAALSGYLCTGYRPAAAVLGRHRSGSEGPAERAADRATRLLTSSDTQRINASYSTN